MAKLIANFFLTILAPYLIVIGNYPHHRFIEIAPFGTPLFDDIPNFSCLTRQTSIDRSP